MIALTSSSTLILILNFSEQLFLIDKTKKKVDKQNVFYPKKCPKIYFFKQWLTCLFLILLINANKRINEHKHGFDI